MPCYRPLHLKNNINHFSSDAHSLYFSVPCGKCEECARARQSEWFVRTYYHWLDVKRKGGDAFMFTLTYNNDNLPTYNGVKCFSRDDIELFIKRLQERLWRLYKVHLSFILTCEFGNLFQRPHYHVIFFIDKHLMPYLFYSCVNKTWQHGFIYSGKNGGLLTSHHGILYVTKYITKDLSFYKLDKQIYSTLKDDYQRLFDAECLFSDIRPLSFDDLLKNKDKWSDNDTFAPLYKEFLLRYRRMTPFTAHSINFGRSLVDYYFKECYNSNDDSCRVPSSHGYLYVPAPRFIKRLLYYKRVPNDKDGKLTKFVLTDDGVKHMVDTLDNRIQKMSDKFKQLISINLTDYQFQLLLQRTHLSFNSRSEYDVFRQGLSSFDTKRLAVYALVYRNHCDFHLFPDVWKDYKLFYQHCIVHPNDKWLNSLSDLTTKDFNSLNEILFNFKPCFQSYEIVYLYLHQVSCLVSEELSRCRALTREKNRKIRDLQKLSKLNLIAS